MTSCLSTAVAMDGNLLCDAKLNIVPKKSGIRKRLVFRVKKKNKSI